MAGRLKCSVVLLLGLAACDSDDNNRVFVPEVPGSVRVINAIPDSPPLAVIIGGNTLATLSFGHSSAVRGTSSGTNPLNAEYVTSTGESVEVVNGFSLEFKEDTEHTVLLSGTVASPGVTLFEPDGPDLEADETEVSFINAVGGSGRLDYYLTSATADLGSASPSATLGFAESAAPDAVTAGEYRIRVTAAGDGQVLYDTGAFELDAGTKRLFVGIDYFGAGTASLRVNNVGSSAATRFPAEALPGEFQVANLIPDSVMVDVYADADPVPVYEGLAFGSVGDPIERSAGSVMITVTAPGDPDAVLYTRDVLLGPGDQRMLIVAGSQVMSTVDGRVLPKVDRRISPFAQLMIIHASETADNVDLFLLEPGGLVTENDSDFGGLGFLSSGELLVVPESYELSVTDFDTATILAGPEAFDLVGGGIYTVMLTDADGGGSPSQFLLTDDFEGQP